MGGKDYEESLALANQVVVLPGESGIQKPTVEQVQDAVEKVLIETDTPAPRKFIFYIAQNVPVCVK